MSVPSDPDFESSRAEYDFNSSRIHKALNKSPLHGNMYTSDPPPPIEDGGKVQRKMNRFRAFIDNSCCSCVQKMPSIVLVIAICLAIALLLALIPAVFILTNAVSGEAQAHVSPGVEMEILRETHKWPGFNQLEDEADDVIDAVNRAGPLTMHGIPSTSLFPPNVSMCLGFGFACTNLPNHVISTSLRCDGKDDCLDGSDELNCKECQTAFFCSSSSTSDILVCLQAEQICDGVPHCPDSSDEEKYCKGTCSPDEYKCDESSICLPSTVVCNGILDCRFEDDEANCTQCVGGAKFCASSNSCIAPGLLCDGLTQCADGSDEKDCNCRACSGSGKALCSDGTCIERSKLCDGVPDCKDGIDEENCPGSCLFDDWDKMRLIVCPDGRRYPELEVCSGLIENCAYNCTKCDEKMAFTCKDGKCIPKMTVCDGIEDCAGGEDEKNCECNGSVELLTCPTVSGTNKCVTKDMRCDGVWDCEDGSDERKCEKCPPDSIYCKNEKICMPAISRCDGIAQCGDGSDEIGCTCEECTGRHSKTYMCEESLHCFRRDEVCAPYTLCPNATKADKVYCAARAMRGMDFS